MRTTYLRFDRPVITTDLSKDSQGNRRSTVQRDTRPPTPFLLPIFCRFSQESEQAPGCRRYQKRPSDMGRTLAFTIDRHSCQFPLRSMETCIETTALVCSRAGYGGRHINSATAPTSCWIGGSAT
jgi:hypothetical protein